MLANAFAGAPGPFGEPVHFHHSVSLEINIQVGLTNGRPYRIEHEAEDDGIGRAQNTELPTDQLIIWTALLPWPDPIQC